MGLAGFPAVYTRNHTMFRTCGIRSVPSKGGWIGHSSGLSSEELALCIQRKFLHSTFVVWNCVSTFLFDRIGELYSPFGGKVPSLSLQGLRSACTSNHTKHEELTEQGPPSYPSILVSTRLNQSSIAVEQRTRARILLASSRRVISSAYTALNTGRTTPVCVPPPYFDPPVEWVGSPDMNG